MAESQAKARSQPVAADTTDQETDLLDYFLVLWRARWMLCILCLVAMGTTVAVVLTRPRYYESSVTIVPPLEALQKQFGGDGFGALGNPLLRSAISGLTGSIAGIYVEILESREMADTLIDQFRLMEVYEKVGNRPRVRRLLAKRTRIEATKDGAVKIAVQDRDPNRAAAMTVAFVEELDRQNKKLSVGQATSKRVFLENRLQEVEAKLKRFTEISTHETKVQEMLYELLVRECELAKIEEARNMPTIQVLDPAAVSELPVPRGVAVKGALAGVAAFILGVFLASTREHVIQCRRRHRGTAAP